MEDGGMEDGRMEEGGMEEGGMVERRREAREAKEAAHKKPAENPRAHYFHFSPFTFHPFHVSRLTFHLFSLLLRRRFLIFRVQPLNQVFGNIVCGIPVKHQLRLVRNDKSISFVFIELA